MTEPKGGVIVSKQLAICDFVDPYRSGRFLVNAVIRVLDSEKERTLL